MATTTAVPRFFDAAEFEAATSALRSADVTFERTIWNAKSKVDAAERQPSPYPSFADVGLLVSFAADIDHRAREFAELASTLQDLVTLADLVRGERGYQAELRERPVERAGA
jgi:hypothetical protein